MNTLQSLLLSAAAVAATAVTAQASTSAEQNAALTTSALSSGHWVKITADGNGGIYQLTHERLRQLGFSNPADVHVYGYGTSALMQHDLATAPVDLPEVASMTVGDKMVMYLPGVVDFSYSIPENDLAPMVTRTRNTYASQATYFLSDVKPMHAAVISTVPAPDFDVPAARTSHISITFHEDEQLLPADGGNTFLGPNILQPGDTDLHVTVTKPASDTATLEYIGGIRLTSNSNSNLVLNAVDNEAVDASLQFSNDLRALKANPYDAFHLCKNVASMTIPMDDSTELTFRPKVDNAARYVSFAAMDHWAFRYERQNDVADDVARFMTFLNVDTYEFFNLSGTRPGTMVWDVTNPARVVNHELSADGTASFSTGGETRTLLAFDSQAALPEPAVADADMPHQNLHGMATPDMVIITTPVFEAQARRLAEIHRTYTGVEAEVVLQQQIFNEFSSGTPHPMAIRSFLRMLHDRSDRLQALLLYGSGSTFNHTQLISDPSLLITSQNEDLGNGGSIKRPTDQVFDNYGNFDMTRAFSCDAYFGKLGDPTATEAKYSSPFFRVMTCPLTLAVGRLPISSLANANDYNTKAEHYLQCPPTAATANRALFMSGYATRNEDMHMADAEALLQAAYGIAGDRLTTFRAAHNLFAPAGNYTAKATARLRAIITNARQQGVSFMTFFGHGGNTEVGQVWTQGTERALTHPGLYPVAFFGTCHFTGFDVYTLGLSADMIFKANGGPIALVGAGRQVYQARNTSFGVTFTSELFSAPDLTAVGHVYRLAHNQVVNSSNKAMMCNTMCYNYFGDPMMPWYTVSRGAEITAVNSQPTVDAAMIPLSINTFEGIITAEDGSVDTDFNGVVKISVFDCPFTAKNTAPAVTNQNPTTIDEMTLDHEQLTELTGEVKAGRFTVKGFLPACLRSGDSNRVTIYAHSADKTVRAGGAVTTLAMNSELEPVNEELGEPEITEFYIESPDYNGAALHTTSTRVYATIQAPAGLKNASQFGNSLRLQLDGSVTGTPHNMLNGGADGSYTMMYDLSDLASGNHTLQLQVTDCMGRQAHAQLAFSVEQRIGASLHVEEATATGITFSLTHELDNDATATVVVEDYAGNVVATLPVESSMATWALTAPDGEGTRAVATGHYVAYARVVGRTGRASTERVHLAVD